MATTPRSNRPPLKEGHQRPFQSQARCPARRRCTSYPNRRAVAAHNLSSCFVAEKLMTRRLSPHCGADSSADCACASANECTRRSCDEKAASATETRASQNRTATYPQRTNNKHHPTHPTFPQRGNYLQQFLTAGESPAKGCDALRKGPEAGPFLCNLDLFIMLGGLLLGLPS